MLRPDTFALTALFAFLSAFGPLSVDLFLPSMPEIGRAFGASPSVVQLTITAYLIGFAIGQIVYGPVSDRLGRKPTIIAAVTIYCIATAVCMAAPTIETLVAARMVQALGVAGSTVVVRAMVRDLYEGARAGQQLSAMSMIMGVMPIIAPLIGGLLLTFWHWRAGFVFQFVVGAIAVLSVWRFLPETRARAVASLPMILAGYREIGTHPVFLANLAVGAAGHCGIFAWIAGSSYVMQGIFGLSPFEYSLCFALSCVGYLVGGGIATRIVLRLGLDKTAGLGAAAVALGGLAMVATVASGKATPLTLTLAMDLYFIGLGLLTSQMIAAALTPFPDKAGTASSLIGCTQQCISAMMGTIVGHNLGQTAWPVALGLAIAGCSSLVLWIVTRPVRTRAAI